MHSNMFMTLGWVWDIGQVFGQYVRGKCIGVMLTWLSCYVLLVSGVP